MIPVTPLIAIGEDELSWHFTRARGPGGQRVNKVSTAVSLRFDAAGSPSLPEDVRARLLSLAGHRATGEGVIVIRAERFRTVSRNREDAMERLLELIRAAAVKPKARRATRPGKGARQRRLDAKRRRSATKRGRGRVDDDA